MYILRSSKSSDVKDNESCEIDLTDLLNSEKIKSVFHDIIKSSMTELNQKVSKLQEELTTLRESNIQLIYLLTNSESKNKQNNTHNDEVTKNQWTSVNSNTIDSNKKTDNDKVKLTKSTKVSNKTSEPIIGQKISTNNMPMPKQQQNKNNSLTKTVYEDDDFTMVYKNRKERRRTLMQTNENENQNKNNNKIIIGTSIDNDDPQESLQAADKKLWLYIARCKPHSTEDKWKHYLEEKCPGREFIVQALTTVGNLTFKIGADLDLEPVLYNAALWPKGILVKRFNFFRQKRRFRRN